MQVTNIYVESYGSGDHPDGICADVVLSDNVTLAVYRDWDKPVWYLYDVEFGPSNEGPSGSRGVYVAGIDNITHDYVIPDKGPITEALERAVDAIRAEYSPA